MSRKAVKEAVNIGGLVKKKKFAAMTSTQKIDYLVDKVIFLEDKGMFLEDKVHFLQEQIEVVRCPV